MIVKTLWIMRKGYEMPELLEAWDEYTIDENLDGWYRACEEALSRVGDEVEGVRYINLEASDAVIAEAFDPVETMVSVEVEDQ